MVRPPLVLLATVLVALQGLVVLVGGVWLGVEVFATTDARPLGIGLGVLALIVGGVLLVAAAGIRQQRSWVRGPVVTWEIITAFLAMQIARSGLWEFAVPLFVLAVGVGVLLAGPWVLPRRDPDALA